MITPLSLLYDQIVRQVEEFIIKRIICSHLSLLSSIYIYIYIYIVTISKAIVIYLLPFYLQQFLLYLFISQIIICICFINLFIFQYNISLFFSLCTNDYIYIIIKLSFPFSTASTSLLSIRQLTPRVSLINPQTKQI